MIKMCTLVHVHLESGLLEEMSKFGGDVLETLLLPVNLQIYGKCVMEMCHRQHASDCTKLNPVNVGHHTVRGCVVSSDLIHLVDGHGQLSDAQRAHQQSVLPGLAARLEARLELPPAGVHHQHRHVGLEAGKIRITGQKLKSEGD